MSEHERTIWCGNLSGEVTDEVLYELFLQAGPLERVHRPRDKETGEPRLFAFITYEDEETVPYALELYRDTHLFNRALRLQPQGTEAKKLMQAASGRTDSRTNGRPNDRGGDRFNDRGGDRFSDRNGDRYNGRSGDRFSDRGGDRYGGRQEQHQYGRHEQQHGGYDRQYGGRHDRHQAGSGGGGAPRQQSHASQERVRRHDHQRRDGVDRLQRQGRW